jgi:hypothetical protein
MIHEIKDSIQNKIFSNIASKGLLPSAQLMRAGFSCLGSGDLRTEATTGNEIVCINELQTEYFANIKHLMNDISTGAWPIILERAYKL